MLLAGCVQIREVTNTEHQDLGEGKWIAVWM